MIENNPFDCKGFTIMGGLFPDFKCFNCGHYSTGASKHLADSPGDCDQFTPFSCDDDWEYE